MFKSEKTLSIPGDYPVVFESCVEALKDVKVRVKSANPATGVVSGRTYALGISSMDRVDVLVQRGVGQCVVTMSSEFSSVAVTDYGRNARRVDRFFNALLARVAPLAGDPEALSSIASSSGTLPSRQYSSAPMRTQLKETSGGQAVQWVLMIGILLFAICLFLSVFTAIANTPH